MTDRKQRADSVSGDIEAFQNASLEVDLPAGVSLDTDEERVIWKQFTAVRAKSAWRDFDLLLLVKAVKLEYQIRKTQATLAKVGPVIPNQKGTVIENPLLRVADTLQRQQLAIIRSLSLNQTESDPRTLNAQGIKEQEAKQTMGMVSLESLIARPSTAH